MAIETYIIHYGYIAILVGTFFEGETVLDPFLGSGTTLKVARISNRKGIGFEINPEFRELIRKRILEDWSPPVIEDGYTTLGFNTLAELIDVVSQTTLQNASPEKNPPQLYNQILKKLVERKLLTKAQAEKMYK